MNAPGPACLICLSPEPPDSADGGYHRACLLRLFGTEALPEVRFEATSIVIWERRSVGKMSISGAQPKATLSLSTDRSVLLPSDRGGAYIIKPRHTRFTHVPENEHLTMCIARLVGLRTAECGLFRLRDGTIAYLTRRFDRTEHLESPKRTFVDFCQLAEKPSINKDDSTAEECAALAQVRG